MRITIVFLGLLLAVGGLAQDRIVTIDNDTIACTITMVRTKRIHYVEERDGKESHSSILKDQVASYVQQGYAPVFLDKPAPPVQRAEKREPERSPRADSLRAARSPAWSIFLGASYVKLIGPSFGGGTAGWDGHFDAFRKGVMTHVGFNYYLNQRFGFGVRIYSADHRTHSTGLQVRYNSGHNVEDSVSTLDVSSHGELLSFGPAITLRLSEPNAPAVFSTGLCLGYTIYLEEHEIGEERQLFAGESVHAVVHAACDLRLSRYITLGALATYGVTTVNGLRISAYTNTQQVLVRESSAVDLRRFSIGAQLAVVF
ncbi:MAG: hypothetical protein IPJ76_14770 [Flavobacteriales bacterium]|nr:MAG: hypothetical protein IPJ76_14770 [Flavobacteriales bacterium]